jgi:hypothetical protein
MRFVSILLIPLLLHTCSDSVSMEEVSYVGRPHILVHTKALDYYYDARGGGFSRILDREGNDWVGFRMEPWGSYPASAASSYRGLPNLVYGQEDEGAGHPGHDRCSSRMEGHQIITESRSKKWLWSWEFHDDHAVLEILQADPSRPYWFLYEGTPGGSYDPQNSYFGSDQGGPFPGGHDYYRGEVLWGQFRWFYAGCIAAPATFYMIQEDPDNKTDMISFLGNTDKGLESPDGMTVFGFGRDTGATPLLTGPGRFVIGMYPERIESPGGHQKLAGYLETLLKGLQ